jgi:hypothetical protein
VSESVEFDTNAAEGKSLSDRYAVAVTGVIGAFTYFKKEGEMAINSRNSLRFVLPVLALTTLVGTACTNAPDQSVLERLQRLEDKEAIYSVLQRFFEYQETRNRDAYANLFAPDGELILRVGHQKGGPDGIRGNGRSGGGARNETPTEPNRHILSNVHIELDGDKATAVSRWTLLVPSEDDKPLPPGLPPRVFRVAGTGQYCDKLVRHEGEWKILQRIIYCTVPEGMTPVHGDPAL